jgi:hypothetical protein
VQTKPAGQLVGVQRHCPCALQTKPAAQLVGVQRQTPSVQLAPDPQSVHGTPPVPQLFGSCSKHSPRGPSMQHPLGQVVASQWQTPLTQCPLAPMHSTQASPFRPHASLAVPG